MKMTKIADGQYAVVLLFNAKSGTLKIATWLSDEEEADELPEAPGTNMEGFEGDWEDEGEDMIPVPRRLLAHLKDVQEDYANLTLRLRFMGINPATRSAEEAIFKMSDGQFPTDLLTPEEAASELGVSLERLERWQETRPDELRVYRVNDTVRYSPHELKRFRRRHGGKLPED